MENNGLTILIPCYNVSEYLHELLDDITDQIQGDQISSVNVVVVDDGSTDFTESMIADYQNYDWFEYFKRTNHGIAATRNFAIAQSHTKYTWMIDADDLIADGAIAGLLSIIDHHHPDLIRVGYSNVMDNLSENSSNISIEPDILHDYVVGDFKAYLWQFIYRTDLLKSVKIPDVYQYEDLAVMYQLLQVFQGLIVLNVSGDLYRYRIRDNSIVHTPTKQSVQSMQTIFAQVQQYEGTYASEIMFLVCSAGAQIAIEANDMPMYRCFKKHLRVSFCIQPDHILNLKYWSKYFVVKFPLLRRVVIYYKRLVNKI